jgi:hypothetical protein
MMEEQWIIDRAQLRQLLRQHPQWSTRQYAQAVGRSRKWVQKWKPRLQGTALDDQTVLHSQSRARKTPPEPYHPAVIARILELRDQPPAEVPRKLGAPTILYYLQQDECLRPVAAFFQVHADPLPLFAWEFTSFLPNWHCRIRNWSFSPDS